MAEKRCPMCGKENPEDAEVCQYCHARLKPLIISPFDENQAPRGKEEDSSLPDWLKDLQPQGDEGFEGDAGLGMEDADLPDWLKDVPSGNVPQDEEPPEETIQEDDSELPDWLARVRKKSQEETPPEENEPDEPSLVGWEKPDWGSDLEKPEEEAPAPTGAEVFVPDWLADLSPAESQPAETTDLPEWLNQAPDEGEPETGEPVAPDWLAQIDQSAGFEPHGEETAAVEPPTLETPEEEQPESPAEVYEVPSWLTQMESNAEKQGSSVPAIVFDDEEALDLSEEEQEEAIFETPDLSGTPEWLSNIAKEETPEKGSPEEGEAPPRLEKAQLPSWLEAMRPIEAAAPAAPLSGESAAEPEKAGPLAGMRGVLPVDIGFSRMKKPAVHSIKLQVTDNQKSHVALLEGLLANEDEPKVLPKQPSITSQSLVRIGVALLLITVVLLSLWAAGGLLPRPGSGAIPVEVVDAQTLISQVGADQAVLVAYDYEPGLAGELEAVSGAVLSQLAERGAAIAAVSTTTNGPLLAQRWYDTAVLNGQAPSGQFFNLGYIPAGPAGLLAFASNPRAVTPYDLKSTYVWGEGPFAGIQSVENFRLVVVLTDSPDDARSWIEQVQPLLQNSNTPLLIVSSAQAEPMIRPYYENSPKQVDGLVAGLTGSMAYETRTGRPNLAGESWDTFSIGIVTAVIILLAGSLVSGGLSLAASAKKNTGEEVQ